MDYSYFESNKTCQKSLVNDLLTVEIWEKLLTKEERERRKLQGETLQNNLQDVYI